jgi:hypothetical protein
MKRNIVGAVVFGAVLAFAGAASAQTIQGLPLVGGLRAVPGVGGPAAGSFGVFTATANISSVLNYTQDAATLSCGTVSPSLTDLSECPNASGGRAKITVHANTNWGITVNDGATYSTNGVDQNTTTLNNTNAIYPGTFQLTIAQSFSTGQTWGNGTAISGAPTATANLPTSGAGATIEFAGKVHTASGVPGTDLDFADQQGSYSGQFTVVLFEDP